MQELYRLFPGDEFDANLGSRSVLTSNQTEHAVTGPIPLTLGAQRAHLIVVDYRCLTSWVTGTSRTMRSAIWGHAETSVAASYLPGGFFGPPNQTGSGNSYAVIPTSAGLFMPLILAPCQTGSSGPIPMAFSGEYLTVMLTHNYDGGTFVFDTITVFG